MDFDQVADELYALPPPRFTEARNAAAARARAAGERALATRIGKLRRPTLGAWLANLLCRDHPDETRALLDLASGLRDAQAHVDGDQLRELTRRRRALVSALTRQAAQAAVRAGLPVGEGPLSDLELTLQAVLSDQRAADAFATGRLTTAQGPTAPTSGPGPDRAGPATQASAGRQPRTAPAAAGRHSQQAEQAQRQAEREQRARQAQEEAEQLAKAAVAAAAAARKELQRTTAQRERLQRRIEELAEQLRRVRAEERGAAAAERAARTKVETTDREARRAEGRARDTADHLRHLRRPRDEAA